MLCVASYCRVSTDKADQAHSFEAQQRYFRAYIAGQPEWVLYDIYADEGITGTSTKKRVQFNRMIDDAYQGRFQLILTKEVSRFSRNILDTIAFTRALKARGVGVLFMNDGINTWEPDAELRLSIMGSIAQEESRRISSRVKWGQTRQMERGVVFGASLLGYDVRDGQLHIDPAGAEVVRLIFHKYAVEKKGTTAIARELQEAGYRTQRGSAVWSNSHIIKILKNEKYAGDLVQKKTVTLDYLTHAKTYNHGEEALITLREHHEPIISRSLWALTQAELERRSHCGTSGAGHGNRYAFSGKIRCGECGGSFVSRSKKRKDGTVVRRWRCGTAEKLGVNGCKVGRLVGNDEAVQLLQAVLRRLPLDKTNMVQDVAALAWEAIQADMGEAPDSLRASLDRLQSKRETMLDSYLAGDITKEDMQTLTQRYDHQRIELQARLSQAERRETDTATLQTALTAELEALLRGERESDGFYRTILDHMTIYQNGCVAVRLNQLSQVFWFGL